MTKDLEQVEAMMTKDYSTYPLDGALPDDASIDAPVMELQPGAPPTPSMVDLARYCSPVEDQGHVGSCVANAVVGALEYLLLRDGYGYEELSRLFVYYNARRIGDRLGQSGTTAQRALAGIMAWGVCPASMWPYQPLMVDSQPTTDCYTKAQNFKGLQIAQVGWGDGVRQMLANNLPVCIAMRTAPGDFARARESGKLEPPANGQWEQAGGGHAMLAVGYDDHRNAWLVRNSWGAGWGNGGYVWIDYDYLHHYTTGENYRPPPWVISQTERLDGFARTGPTLDQFTSSLLKRAPAETRAEVQPLKEEIGKSLSSNLTNLRGSLKDRLRGPGAGGGY